MPYALPAIAVLWLSVSPFTRIARGPDREDQQTRFWLLNHRAVASAIIAAAAFAIIAFGLLIIERSLSTLFGLDASRVFYQWLLPITGLFLSPVYWLSTLPKLGDVQMAEAERPEFISKAIGFLGQFVLVPLLLIYALILLAYTGQIIVTQKLPEGMIGWMVMGFVLVGAATWLVLYPPFMRDKPLVKLFRRLWFWLTLLPLGLFFFAVWVRVDAYGLTSERMLLLGGGIWALVIAAIFLVRRGDIRLIPALAGVILLGLSVGPWNYANLPLQQQLHRLDVLVINAGSDHTLSPPRSNWSSEDVARARGIIDYLVSTREGRDGTRQVMAKYGVSWDEGQDGSYVVLEALGLDPTAGYDDSYVSTFATLWRDGATSVPVAATPFFMQSVDIYGASLTKVGASMRSVEVDQAGNVTRQSAVPPNMQLSLRDGHLIVEEVPDVTRATSIAPADLDLGPFAARQTDTTVSEPWIDFSFGGVAYRIAVESVTIDRQTMAAGKPVLTTLQGYLFSEEPRAPTPSP